jgi:citrate lyase beta subunit
LTGDRRNQRRNAEILRLLDAVIRDTEDAARTWARDTRRDT